MAFSEGFVRNAQAARQGSSKARMSVRMRAGYAGGVARASDDRPMRFSVAFIGWYYARRPATKECAMPYARNQDLPESVRAHLPEHAQAIYREAFNHAWDEYAHAKDRRGDESREEVAHKVAWSAVKTKYERGDDGDWHAK
jgi:cation transport regulator